MLLSVDNLTVKFQTGEGEVSAVNGVSFDLRENKILGIVGESGSGKSQLAFAMLGLLAKNGRSTGSVQFNNQEILNIPTDKLNQVRGSEISIIFQDPLSSLNPYMTIKNQLNELLIKHKDMSHDKALKRSLEILDAVKIPDAKDRINAYPHELSGGMRQRVMIAMSLLCDPKLLIADEPTTALDVTIQAQILELLKELNRDFGAAIIMITHDLGVISAITDDVIVMYGGQIMEKGSVDNIFYNSRHPYTKGLLRSVPKIGAGQLRSIEGEPPNMLNMPKGCPFAPRCGEVIDKCLSDKPVLEQYNNMKRACFAST